MAASAASIPSASSPSTLPMSPDRGAAGKLVGDLYIAAKFLVEGPNISIEQVRHEIRTLLSSTSSSTGTTTSPVPPGSAPAAGTSTSAGAPAAAPVPGAISPLEWKKLVTGLLLATQQLPNSIGCLPDALKRELALAIRQGKQLCTAGKSPEATQRVEKAAQIYRTLSGPSYL